MLLDSATRGHGYGGLCTEHRHGPPHSATSSLPLETILCALLKLSSGGSGAAFHRSLQRQGIGTQTSSGIPSCTTLPLFPRIFSFASISPVPFPQIVPFVFSVLFCFFLLSSVLLPSPPSRHLMSPAPYIHRPSSWIFPALSTSEHEKPSTVVLPGGSSLHSHGGYRSHHLKSPCRSTKTSKVLSSPTPRPYPGEPSTLTIQECCPLVCPFSHFFIHSTNTDCVEVATSLS